MHPSNHKLTETILGTSWRRRRPMATLSALLAVVLVIVGFLAAVVVGLSEAVGWVVIYLTFTLVILGVVFGVVGLLVREGGKVYDTRYPHK